LYKYLNIDTQESFDSYKAFKASLPERCIMQSEDSTEKTLGFILLAGSKGQFHTSKALEIWESKFL